MDKKNIYIKNGQRLSDVYSIIEPNTILCKFLTGIGATHLEITAPRHSIFLPLKANALTLNIENIICSE